VALSSTRRETALSEPVTVQNCMTRLVSGTVKFVIDADDLGASVSCGHVIYATGVAVGTGADRWQLVLTRDLRKLRHGRYTLVLRTLHGRRRIVQRSPSWRGPP
jgi:hypothetical protein